ncbi:MAG: hypothetical protein BWY83_02703 [bacterium ADurb.Bin478]|nr:MAG: hypothetical protein BWY83_02703 [bacterium ADurb.Bin478]
MALAQQYGHLHQFLGIFRVGHRDHDALRGAAGVIVLWQFLGQRGTPAETVGQPGAGHAGYEDHHDGAGKDVFVKQLQTVPHHDCGKGGGGLVYAHPVNQQAFVPGILENAAHTFGGKPFGQQPDDHHHRGRPPGAPVGEQSQVHQHAHGEQKEGYEQGVAEEGDAVHQRAAFRDQGVHQQARGKGADDRFDAGLSCQPGAGKKQCHDENKIRCAAVRETAEKPSGKTRDKDKDDDAVDTHCQAQPEPERPAKLTLGATGHHGEDQHGEQIGDDGASDAGGNRPAPGQSEHAHQRIGQQRV